MATKARGIKTIVFSVNGDVPFSAGDRGCVRLDGQFSSIKTGENGDIELTMQIEKVSPTEKDAGKSRADVDLENMAPKTDQWAIKQIVAAIAKTPADHSLDQIKEG